MNAQLRPTYDEAFALKEWRTTEIRGSAPWRQPDQPVKDRHKILAWLFVSHGTRVMTNVPVDVLLCRDEGRYYAECPTLHVFADGDSYESARSSLDEQVVYFYQQYTAIAEDRVIGLAAELRAFYRQRFSLTQE
ncbi:MAG TPA: hypothetical protein VHY19_01185 [Steroidobacteraceae bacterium]|jgi:hypothetical protein|nr:hypothetical protein [Steroidobacteraceae bacterium]